MEFQLKHPINLDKIKPIKTLSLHKKINKIFNIHNITFLYNKQSNNSINNIINRYMKKENSQATLNPFLNMIGLVLLNLQV